MATTYVDYTATADQISNGFEIPFEYLEDEHVTVEVDGVVNSDTELTTTTPVKIKVLTGVTAGQNVRVRRKSQPDTNLVDFVNGSVLTESELDRAYQHNRFLNEEISELNDASVQKKEGSDNFTVSNNRLVELADPVDAQDATTKNYVDTQDALQVTKTGDSMSGALAMGSNKITGLGTPTLTDDAATKTYVDAKVNQVSSGATSPPTKWVFTGTAGANTTYSVTGAEVNGDTAYDVSVDGSVLEPTTDYTVDPDTDTLTIVNTLSGGEDIVVIERGFGIAVSTGSIGEDQLQTNSVSTAKIQNDAVDGTKIQNDAVDGTKIADDSIDSEHYVDESIDTAHLADHSVTAVKISNTDPIFNVQTTGEVGIGTTSPASPLHVKLATDENVRIVGGSGDTRISALNDAGSTTTQLSVQGDPLLFRTTGGAERMRIDDVGNVGIGTTSPAAPLEVSSTTGGVVFPRLTTTQRDAIGSPTDGETIFNTTTNQVESYNGTSWGATGSGVSKATRAWTQLSSSADGTNFTFTHNLGTTDVIVQVFVNTSASDTNAQQVSTSSFSPTAYGFLTTNFSTNSVTIQLSNGGFYDLGGTGSASVASYASKYIKVVVIG